MCNSSLTTAFTLCLTFAACASSPKPVLTPSASRAETANYSLLRYVQKEKVGGLKLVEEMGQGDAQRKEIEKILSRPLQRWVLALGETMRKKALARCVEAKDECKRRFEHPAYIVIVKRGNRPKRGLAIKNGKRIERLPNTWYIEVDPRNAVTLFPHEYGHVLMFGLLPEAAHQAKYGHERQLPHTTGAITDDITAFSEGWGIHFETLVGERRENAKAYARVHRDVFPVKGDFFKGDAFAPVRDLLNYAQSYRRYTCIKENCFAACPRPNPTLISTKTPTVAQLRSAWSDTTYDPARLRTLEQMAASEGVIATLFYRLATAPSPSGSLGRVGDPALPDPERYAAFFDAFAELRPERTTKTPWVLAFLETLLKQANAAERKRIARIATEVFHHTLGMRDAPAIFARAHAAALLLDQKAIKAMFATAGKRMTASFDTLVATPEVLMKRAAPEIWLVHGDVKLAVERMRIKDLPVAFDLNTATVPLLMTLPGIGFDEAERIAARRRKLGGFQALSELFTLVPLPKGDRERIEAMRKKGK